MEPHIVSAPNEYRMGQSPADCVSALKFSPDLEAKHLLVSSWDASVRLFNVSSSAANAQLASYSHSGPVLCCAFVNKGQCASGGLDNSVKLFDFQTQTETTMGLHDKPVRTAEFSDDIRYLVTGSWDQTIKFWDPRQRAVAHTVQQPERVYAMDVIRNRLVVGTAGRKVWIWDVRNMGAPEQRRESSLKYQTRCIKAFPNGEAFVLSSIEGRVAVEYFDQSAEIQKRKYAFKCHRIKEDGLEQIYPVNAIAFHPIHNTFATGGSDGLVNMWDPFNKKRLCQFHKYPTSISSLAFSPDGAQLAIAASYQFELPNDPSPVPQDSVLIRKVTDQETKPKQPS